MKKRIVIFADHYLPGFRAGGPVRSLQALVESFQHEFELFIITRRRDFNQQAPYDLPENQPVQRDGVTIYYQPDSMQYYINTYNLLKKIKPDLIYCNSFFSARYAIYPLTLIKFIFKNKIKVLLAPRGELSSGALSIKSWKKKLYLCLVKFLGIYNNINWHTTAIAEENEIKKNFSPNENNIYTVPNLKILAQSSHAAHEKKPNELKVIFLSRISAKKNLAYALEVLASIQQGEIHFDIYGPIEDDAYWNKCQQIIAKMPANVQVNYQGEVSHEQVAALFSQYHVFLFPTLGENFGHVIIEALSSGCLVITSDQVPWHNLEQADCGWNIALKDKNSYSQALVTLLQLDHAEFESKSIAAKALVESRHNSQDIYQKMYSMLSQLTN